MATGMESQWGSGIVTGGHKINLFSSAFFPPGFEGSSSFSVT